MDQPVASPEKVPVRPDVPAFERGLWDRAWFIVLLLSGLGGGGQIK
jgi:hypothetical protein